MSNLTAKEQELVALGAAYAGNCIPCMEYHVPAARKAGLTDEQIQEAVELAEKVKQVPSKKVFDTAKLLLAGVGGGLDV